jgi:hypothetical protein
LQLPEVGSTSGCSGHSYFYWTDELREVKTLLTPMNHFLVTDIPNGHLLQDLQIIHSWWVHLRSFRGYVTYSTTMGLSCLDIHATQFEENVEISNECLKNAHSVVENLDI